MTAPSPGIDPILTPLVNPWRPGTTYPPGSVVRPTASPPVQNAPITNGDFETASLTDWTLGSGWSRTTSVWYQGTACMMLAPGSGSSDLVSKTTTTPPQTGVPSGGGVAVAPGQQIIAGCMYNAGGQTTGADVSCLMGIVWYDSSGTYISTSYGAPVKPRAFGFHPPAWQAYQAIGIAPSTAAWARLSLQCRNNGTNPTYVDMCSWNYIAPAPVQPKLFWAVQPTTGKSGQNEPAWRDTTTGGYINDPTPAVASGVQWSSQPPDSILWVAHAMMLTGTIEPVWPTIPGAMVNDGTCSWMCVTPQVSDPNVPVSKARVMGASKIFAGNSDIVNYCKTLDCTDWTAEANAGYLPVGLQNYGDNPVAALGLYRSNMVVFNAQGFQMWQIDEDPANMNILDAKPIGCRFQRSVVPVNDDLFFLTDVGLRSMGIAASSGSLMSGDVGMPIDPIVFDALTYIAANPGVIDKIASIHYPGAGQFWFAIPGWDPNRTTNPDSSPHTPLFTPNPAQIPGDPTNAYYVKAAYDQGTHVLVYTQSRTGEVGAWSHYNFPCVIECFCIMDDKLYIKAGDWILSVANPYYSDCNCMTVTGTTPGAQLNFPCVIQWPWLDLGTPGATKKMLGFDFAADPASGVINIAFGYDQSNPATFTPGFDISVSDTIPGMMIPLPMMVASVSPRVILNGLNPWKFAELIVYTADTRPTA
jgi:hypothetical protein